MARADHCQRLSPTGIRWGGGSAGLYRTSFTRGRSLFAHVRNAAPQKGTECTTRAAHSRDPSGAGLWLGGDRDAGGPRPCSGQLMLVKPATDCSKEASGDLQGRLATSNYFVKDSTSRNSMGTPSGS